MTFEDQQYSGRQISQINDQAKNYNSQTMLKINSDSRTGLNVDPADLSKWVDSYTANTSKKELLRSNFDNSGRLLRHKQTGMSYYRVKNRLSPSISYNNDLNDLDLTHGSRKLFEKTQESQVSHNIPTKGNKQN